MSVRLTFDSFKLKDLDKKEDRYDDNVKTVFDENGLCRKKLPKGPDSLMRAISEALYFTSNHSADIQQSVLKYLTQLIASNVLTPRLNSFQGSSVLLKDFANNPQLPGFEKTNLELVSVLFRVRVILYTMNEENYLTATIFNNNYPNTIELLRTKTSHYDPVFPKTFMSKAGICQNIILNLIDKAVNGTKGPTEFKDINHDEYVNITYESAQASTANTTKNSLDQFRITRGQHKKSLSDNFNTNFEVMEEQQMKFYEAFLGQSPRDDLIKTFNNRKDTAESNFSINANFDFIDDQNLDNPLEGVKQFAIKNYPINVGNLSPRASAGLELDSPMPVFSKGKFANHPNNLFNENPSLAEIERLEKTVNTATTVDPSKQLGASPYFRNASPPGLSPGKFSQHSFNEPQTPTSDMFSPSPTISRDISSPAYPYSAGSPAMTRNMSQSPFNYGDFNGQRQYSEPQQVFAGQSQQMYPQTQPFTLQPQQFNNMYMKRMGSVGTSVSLQAPQNQPNEFNMGGFEGMGYDQGYEDGMDYDPSMMFGPGGVREKRRPIILDESKERYQGRLKFFDENKKYGFIVMDDDGSDIFVHYDDLAKANINKDLLRTARTGNLIRLSFSCMAYIGKYNRSRKAIDIILLN